MFATTKMSSKGQIVIPESLRENLQLEAGVEFMIISQDDALILKKIIPPNKKDLKDLLEKANALAKKSGMKKEDIQDAIRKYRKGKK